MVLIQNYDTRVWVALRKESVDRKAHLRLCGRGPLVALRKESVDRKTNTKANPFIMYVSLSARRAWIEKLKIGLMPALSPGRSPQGERG